MMSEQILNGHVIAILLTHYINVFTLQSVRGCLNLIICVVKYVHSCSLMQASVLEYYQ